MRHIEYLKNQNNMLRDELDAIKSGNYIEKLEQDYCKLKDEATEKTEQLNHISKKLIEFEKENDVLKRKTEVLSDSLVRHQSLCNSLNHKIEAIVNKLYENKDLSKIIVRDWLLSVDDSSDDDDE